MLKNLAALCLLSSCVFAQDCTLAPSRLQVKDGYNMYLEGQFLWWLYQNDNLYFCQDGPQDTSPKGFNGHLKRMNPDFHPGWKLTFGGLMPYDNWDIHFTWTHFDQSTNAKAANPSIYLGNTFDNLSKASLVKAKYDLDVNMLDAILTRPSWMGERLAISPFIGVRGAWIDQVFKKKAILETNTTKSVYDRARSDFRGAGLTAGFALRYELKSGWCIEGNFLTSGIYGKFVNYYSSYIKAGSSLSDFSTSDRKYFSRDPHQGILFNLEYKLGIGYNRFISQGRYHLGGGIAWEEVFFPNGNRLPTWTNGIALESNARPLTMTNPSPMLSLQGITVRFVFGF